MQYKSLVAATSIVVLGATLLTPNASAEARQLSHQSGGGALIETEVADAITEATNIVGFFSDIDVNIDDIPVMPAVYNDVLAELIDITLNEIDPVELDDYAAEHGVGGTSGCGEIGAQIAHGRAQAISNMSRGDAQATSLNDETTYMFLSHYVDVWNATGCAASATLYADWLTNSDRIAYDAFLNSISMVDAATKIFDIVTSASDAINGSSYIVRKILDPITRFSEALSGASAAYIGDDGIREVTNSVADAVSAMLTEGHDAEYIATHINTLLEPKFDRANAKVAFAGAVLSLMTGNVGGALLSIGVYGLQFVVTGIEGLAQKAAVNTMGYTRSGRVAARYWRYLGLG